LKSEKLILVLATDSLEDPDYLCIIQSRFSLSLALLVMFCDSELNTALWS